MSVSISYPNRVLCHLLLEQDWTESCVESTETIVLQDLGETTDQAIGIGWVRDETDTGGLEWTKGDVSEELGGGSGSEVDSGSVVGSSLETQLRDGERFEELVTSELESTLEEVTSSGWAETSPNSSETLFGDDLLESTDETAVVCGWVKLYPRLDAVVEPIVSFYSADCTDNETGAIDCAQPHFHPLKASTYTSTGVRAPWVTLQQTAPAKANLE